MIDDIACGLAFDAGRLEAEADALRADRDNLKALVVQLYRARNRQQAGDMTAMANAWAYATAYLYETGRLP